MTDPVFRDRTHAGQVLARALTGFANRPDVLVLGLPRGGVPVAFEVALALHAPLDVFVVRKLGVPGQAEYAMGALASGGVRVLNENVVRVLAIPPAAIDAAVRSEQHELERRERLYRDTLPPLDVRARTVILVDDGLATGSTMLAAVKALRQQQPAHIVVAVPTAAAETCEALRREADTVFCVTTPEPYRAVGLWYEDFSQTSDDEVRELLARARHHATTSAAPASTAKTAGPMAEPSNAVDAVRRLAVPLTEEDDHHALLGLIGDAHFVLIGEASHGTHEFYRERARITQRLIAHKGFNAVAIEGDWPDAYRVNRFVRGVGDDPFAVDALAGFKRFPTWMWRNTVVVDFVDWLRAFNDALPSDQRVGFYGMDLYSLNASMHAVLRYLDQADPDAARRARERYACFDHFGDDGQTYGLLTGLGHADGCEAEVVAMLVEMQRRAAAARLGGEADVDPAFDAEQNARLVKNAEEYYRAMYLSDVSSWNLRDRHMVETLGALEQRLGHRGARPKIVVWAHNSHLGDARATEMGTRRRELNVGQLMRERHGGDAVLIGFSTHRGSVTASSDWGAPAERKQVLPSRPDSHENVLHATGIDRFLLPLRGHEPHARALRERRLERAIGVIYRPETERQSHYFLADLPQQFDALIHIDVTRALEPLERGVAWNGAELPETYPAGV